MELDNLINHYICLCEVRGELSPENNAKLDHQLDILAKRIKVEELLLQLKELQAEAKQ
jgi:hypothetical protein|tara:strand:- start:2578 stop:2751 length:174 start_codon:yes stop_codon:yes gene_type:complete